AERRGISVADARGLLLSTDLSAPPAQEPVAQAPAEDAPEDDAAAEADTNAGAEGESASEEDTLVLSQVAGESSPPVSVDTDVWQMLENGVREISGEVRNSLDFHRSQEGGGEVSHIVLSVAAAEIPGFAEGLEVALRVHVRGETVAVADGPRSNGVREHRLAVATGLAT